MKTNTENKSTQENYKTDHIERGKRELLKGEKENWFK